MGSGPADLGSNPGETTFFLLLDKCSNIPSTDLGRPKYIPVPFAILHDEKSSCYLDSIHFTFYCTDFCYGNEFTRYSR